MDTTGDDPDGAGTYGQNMGQQNQDGRQNENNNEGMDGRFMQDKPQSKPNSSKNK